MSRKVEQAVGGLVQSLWGSLAGPTKGGLFGGVSGTGVAGTQPSLAFLAFVEKVKEAASQSSEAERELFSSCAASWQQELCRPGCSHVTICELLQRALVAAVRGYTYDHLHIHAVKLTQSTTLAHKKMGYLYLSVCVRDSELSLLVTNTLHKDLTSSDALAVLASLTALPSILAVDLPPQLTQALTSCLHHPMGLVRRRACQVLYAGVAVWDGGGEDSSALVQQLQAEGAVVTPLLQLLSDPDPGVALAATQTLAQLYVHSPTSLRYVRSSVACSAAYLLTQAFNATLPHHYSQPPLHAPHAQLDMIRVLRLVCCGREDDWRVPDDVIKALTPVLTQVWGSGHVGVCMTLLEAVLLTMELPLQHTTPGLRNTAINTLLGFLQSSNGKLQYAAVQALTDHWPVFRDAVTPAHLTAVVHNLQHSSSTAITAKTLLLLYTMTNHHNYQSVVSTLVQYCATAGPSLRSSIHARLATIVLEFATDALWCITALRNTVLTQQPPALVSALTRLIINGLHEGQSALVSPTLSLVREVMQQQVLPLQRLLVAPVLARLNSISGVQLQGDEHLKQGEHLQRVVGHDTPREEDGQRALLTAQDSAMLLSVNEHFIDSIKLNDNVTDDQCIFECLKNIGLNNTHLKQKIIDMVFVFRNSSNLTLRCQAREVLSWLENESLAIEVIRVQQEISENTAQIDWSLTFVEEFINESLEKHKETPYIPFGLSVPGGEKHHSVDCSDPGHDDTNTPRRPSTCYSTPRLSLEEDGHTTTHHQSLPLHNLLPRLNLQEATDESTLLSQASSSVGSVPFSIGSAVSTSNQELARPNLSSSSSMSMTHPSLEDRIQPSTPLTANNSVISSLYSGGQKLLWSMDGRAEQAGGGTDFSKNLDMAAAEGIEMGAEAHEELQLSDELDKHVSSTASTLAKALYAGLGRKT